MHATSGTLSLDSHSYRSRESTGIDNPECVAEEKRHARALCVRIHSVATSSCGHDCGREEAAIRSVRFIEPRRTSVQRHKNIEVRSSAVRTSSSSSFFTGGNGRVLSRKKEDELDTFEEEACDAPIPHQNVDFQLSETRGLRGIDAACPDVRVDSVSVTVPLIRAAQPAFGLEARVAAAVIQEEVDASSVRQ